MWRVKTPHPLGAFFIYLFYFFFFFTGCFTDLCSLKRCLTLLSSSFRVSLTSSSGSISSCHFSDNSTAILLVAEIFTRIILRITTIGTERSIPTTPQSFPQNQSASIITSGDRLSLFPTNFGSTIFPINTCAPIRPVAISTEI